MSTQRGYIIVDRDTKEILAGPVENVQEAYSLAFIVAAEGKHSVSISGFVESLPGGGEATKPDSPKLAISRRRGIIGVLGKLRLWKGGAR